MFQHLFEPGAIGTLRLKNRLIMAPMVRNWATPDGAATARYEAHIERVAKGGVAAIVLEASYVSPEGKGFVRQLGLHDDHVVPALKRLVKAAHRHGARIGPQLFHAGRQCLSAVSGQQPVAPSPIPCPLGQEMPRALDEGEIARIVQSFGQAARRAMQAGCDFVEVHGAHGYLITQFLSASSNARTDGYGGPLEQRMRFLLEVLASVRAATGPDFPITVRLSGEEMTPDGLTIEDTVRICRRLETAGVAAVHISAGAYGSYATGRMISPMSLPDAPLVRLAERVRSAVSIPVIAVDKIRHPELAEELLAYGVADFIALGRPLLADPDWPAKAEAGALAAINKCIACNEGCISRLFAQQDAWCLVNPEAGREAEFASAPPVKGRKRVMVIGGGPGGMAAAAAAARAGHEVALLERSDQLGGALFAAAAPPHRPGWDELRRRLAWSVRMAGVRILTGVEAGPETVRNANPDTVILATGARPRPSPWPSSPEMIVMPAVEALAAPHAVHGPVVVVGGGCSGAETAELLAERGLQVSLVEATGEIADDAPLDERALLLQRLERLGVSLLPNTTVLKAQGGSISLRDASGERAIRARTVVLSLGEEPEDALAKSLIGLAPRILRVGDCVAPRRVTEAILEGTLAGRTLAPPRQESAREHAAATAA
ncbi:MAG: FAD-dependent oxidoreductase [Proteobacteria bacterium]|nr:FAD-dependent oxidoreductase [Pseudomonadota bacterium]